MSNRRTFVRFSFAAVLAIIGLSVSMLSYAQEAEAASVTVNQLNASDDETLGSWTLILPNNERIEGAQAAETLSNLEAGRYTIITTPPEGASVNLRTFHGSEQLQFLKRPQLNFQLEETEDLKISLYYIMSRVGKVSVQSDPQGIAFTIKGPNDMNEEGVTPMSYDDAAEGQYSVQFHALEGCNTPAPLTKLLLPDGRATFELIVECKAADTLRKRIENENEEILTVGTGKDAVLLRDVPKDAWFAPYVFSAARRNVLTGYKDEDGNPTGTFGPENNITIGELSKIAHKLGSISPESFEETDPTNEQARGQWFSPYIASAEARAWTIFIDESLNPLRPATRSEVVVTFLQVLETPIKWQTGQLFTDVSLHTPYAAAIETAAMEGMIEGRTDADGKPLNLFVPDAPINRAEMSKIIDTILSSSEEEE